MADKKITELPALTTAASSDVLYIIDDATGTPVSKQISLLNLLGAVPANTTFAGTATFNSNVSAATGVVRFVTPTTPTSNNATTELGSGMAGSMFWDQNYLYIATTDTEIKRVALNTF